jgi:Tfp pilus assembly protein FimT
MRYQVAPSRATLTRFLEIARCDSRGVTVVEILVVTIIIGLMAQIAAVNLIGQMPRHRLQGATSQIIWDLMAARMKAIMQNTSRIKVTFPNNHAYTIWDDADNDDVVDAGELIAKSNDLYEQYHDVTIAEPLPNTFAFSSRGTSSLVQDINLSNASGATRITVSRTGKATMKKFH